MAIDLKDYVEVPERIRDFRAKHPEGSLQSEVLAWPTSEYPFIVVKAYAYRSPDDPRPGVGHAAEPFPGRTPYTKESELMNAETSAWGRALVAVLAADTKRGIASAQEVAARQDSTKPTGSSEASAPDVTVDSPSTEAEEGDGDQATAASASPSEAKENFQFTAGPLAGRWASEVALNNPEALQARLDEQKIQGHKREIAEALLAKALT